MKDWMLEDKCACGKTGGTRILWSGVRGVCVNMHRGREGG